MNTPVLETQRLLLRPFRLDDAQAVFDGWESDPDVARYMFWTSHNDIEKTREWVAFEMGQIPKDDWYRFAVVLKETGELVGTVLIYYEEEVAAWEIGYNLGKKHWNKGYTTEAMKKVMEFAVSQLRLSEIVGRHAKENPASGNVMKKLGFKWEKDIPYECNGGAVMREGMQYRFTNIAQLQLIKATPDDAELIWKLQVEAFKELYEKYQDHDTSPANEPIDKVIMRLKQPFTYFYILKLDGEIVGAVRVVDKKEEGKNKRISPIFVMPQHRNKGIAQQAICEVEKIHGDNNWELDTIQSEKGNCYLYEKMGYRATGKTETINDKLTLVFYEKEIHS